MINKNYVDLFNEGRVVDVLYYLNSMGFIHYLMLIRGRFNRLKIKPDGETQYLYYMVQEDFKAIKVGIAKDPIKRLLTLQTGNPQKLLLLFYYDPIFKKSIDINGTFKMVNEPNTIYEFEKHKINWLSPTKTMNEWLEPDDRSLRILVREGLHILDFYSDVKEKGG